MTAFLLTWLALSVLTCAGWHLFRRSTLDARLARGRAMTVVSVAVFIEGMEPTVTTIEGSESLAVRLDRHVTLYGTRPELLAVLDTIVVQVAGTPERDLSAENEALRLGPAAP